jgi:glycosyltransferase involved in cell wall biosynthesis
VKVLHIQKVTGIGGSERHLLELLPALVSRGVEARMCVLGTGAYKPFAEALRRRGVHVKSLPAGPDINPLLIAKLVWQMRAFRPDLVHTHLIHADVHGQLAAQLTMVPAVSSVHSTQARVYLREPYRSGARGVGHLACRTIAISNHVGRFVEELNLARPGTVRVIHYGIDVAGWKLPHDARSAARAALGLASDEIAVGVASRLVPLKGHAFLLDSFQRARRTVEGLRLLVAGDGPLRSQLETKARRAGPPGTVWFLGHLDDMPSFMNACDVVAFPTLPGFGEGFGLAALEAMAAGRPVVATAIDSLPEIVLDGETGYLVPPGSVEGLSEALVELASNEALRRRFGAQARERARMDFPLETSTERMLKVYREVT